MEIGVTGYWIISLLVFGYMLVSAAVLTYIIIRQGIGTTKDIIEEENL